MTPQDVGRFSIFCFSAYIWFVLKADCVFIFSFGLKHYYLIFTFFDKRSRDVESLLRSDLPVSSKVEAIDKCAAFAPSLKIEEGIFLLFSLK